ncbi:MAG: hypothetical protein ABH856_02550 [Patescibacteria group bacterium]|nr:hypothetical protein [Patescibacteria group bacterium]
MTHRNYLTTISIAGLLSWAAFVVVLNKLNPYESPLLALPFFFVSLFLALACTFAVLGFYFRVWLYKNEVFYSHINVALRQGVLLGFIACGTLGFKLLGVLTWWTGLLFVMAVTMLELYFSAKG